ncbi:cold-regulated 413 plasma membrane protein 2-like isoform X2 [Tripterygium wilfordii]|uniref:cold-regulated 413 plasma membrane protein 2-like isoform X2 n=1 Tax=Tripterygium wilfordii TaxID=458696 RepID=UPI0018F84749|nr:cold-regulated 413 plasma membrane protein 2-like isoform X2 [Tripterygium wilfordii]
MVSSAAYDAAVSFQWGGTISALFLLIMNRFGRQSSKQMTLLAVYLFISCPDVLFNILRGQVGSWIAFLVVAANLFFPQTFPASRFILFVITPDWVTDGLRDSLPGGILSIIIGVSIIFTEIRGIGGFRNCQCNLFCFCYYLGIASLFVFTILYLSLETW